MQYKRLQREYDEASGMEAVQPNKRLNQERLRKLQEIGFAWSAKHVRKQRNNSLPLEGPPAAATTAFAALPTPPDVNTTTAGAMTTTMMMMMMPNHLAMAPSAHPPPSVQAMDVTTNTTAAPTPTTVVVAPPLPTLPTRQAAVGRSRSESSRQGAGRLNDQQWEEMYQRLVRYKEEHGDCLVPRKYERDAKLSTWVETQRVSCCLRVFSCMDQCMGIYSDILVFLLPSFGLGCPCAVFVESGLSDYRGGQYYRCYDHQRFNHGRDYGSRS